MDIAAIIAGPEVTAAATWWAHALGRGAPDEGNDRLAPAIPLHRGSRWPTSEERERFTAALRAALARQWRDLHAKGGFQWDARRPERGSTLRSLAVDHRPDPTLSAAALAAGYPLSATIFPLKTTMWIDPGWVVVRCGCRGEQTVVFPTL